jgi:hypothetical protein
MEEDSPSPPSALSAIVECADFRCVIVLHSIQSLLSGFFCGPQLSRFHGFRDRNHVSFFAILCCFLFPPYPSLFLSHSQFILFSPFVCLVHPSGPLYKKMVTCSFPSSTIFLKVFCHGLRNDHGGDELRNAAENQYSILAS